MTIEPKPEVTDADAFRRAGFLAWFARREAAGYTRTALMADIKRSKGRVSQLFDPTKTFGEGAARMVETAVDGLREGYFLELGKSLILGNREISTAEIVGMPGKEGHTTTVNLTPSVGKGRQILPQLTFDRVDLMLLPNDDPQIKALGTLTVEDGGAPYDLGSDKAVILEREVKDTIGLQGHHAIFRPTNGRMIRPTNRPVVVRSDKGTFHFVSYDAMASMPNSELVAVCVHCYQPMDDSPFI